MLTVIEQPSGAAATAKYPHDHHHLTRHNEYALSSVKIIGTGQPQHWRVWRWMPLARQESATWPFDGCCASGGGLNSLSGYYRLGSISGLNVLLLLQLAIFSTDRDARTDRDVSAYPADRSAISCQLFLLVAMTWRSSSFFSSSASFPIPTVDCRCIYF